MRKDKSFDLVLLISHRFDEKEHKINIEIIKQDVGEPTDKSQPPDLCNGLSKNYKTKTKVLKSPLKCVW